MTKKQVIQIFGVLVAAYPNFDKFKSDDQVEGMVNVWATMFADDDAAVVGLAVKRHIMTSKWPPSIAEIRAIMAEITHPDLTPPDKAWEAVADLLYSQGPYLSDSTVDFYLPELIAEAVKAIGWSTLYELHRGHYAGNKDGMDRVAFLAQYEPAYERAMLAASCSKSINAQIAQLRGELTAGGLKKLDEAKMERLRKEDQNNAWRGEGFRRLRAVGSAAALPDPEEDPDD